MPSPVDVADGDPGWLATRRRKRSVDDGMRTVEYTRGRLYNVRRIDTNRHALPGCTHVQRENTLIQSTGGNPISISMAHRLDRRFPQTPFIHSIHYCSIPFIHSTPFIHSIPFRSYRMASNAQDAVPGTLQQGLKDGWFTELSSMWPGQGMSFKVNEVVHTDRSDFQVRAVCGVQCAVCGCMWCAWRAWFGHAATPRHLFAWICVDLRGIEGFRDGRCWRGYL